MSPETIEAIRKDTAKYKAKWGHCYTTNVREIVGKWMLQEDPDALERAEVQTKIKQILSNLPLRERRVAVLLFALEGEEALHPIVVADEVGITYDELRDYERILSLHITNKYRHMLKAAA